MNNYNDIFPFAAYLDNLHRMTESIHSMIPSVGYIASNPLQESMATHDRIYHQLIAPFQNMDLGVRLPETLLHTAISEQLDKNLFNNPFLQDAQIMQSIDKILSPLQDVISSNISRTFENCFSFPSEQFSTILEPLFSNIDDASPDDTDYVIVNEQPIKELCIPDTLLIPFGNLRVKIRTDIFFCIFFGILSFTTSIAIAVASSSNADPIINQALQWQAQTISGLLNSADTSSSSQAELIEAARATFEAQATAAHKQEEAAEAQIRAAHKQEEAAEAQIKAAQAQESAAQALEEAADPIRQAADNMREPEHIEPNK